MTAAEANAVYDVLVRECGASDVVRLSWDPRRAFVSAMADTERSAAEYRFRGALGFGGVFSSQEMRVSCYLESELPEDGAMVERANAALMEMVK